MLAVLLEAVATEHRLELTGLSREVAKASPRAPKQKVKKGYAPRREVDRHVSTARVLRGDERDTRTRGTFHEAGTRKTCSRDAENHERELSWLPTCPRERLAPYTLKGWLLLFLRLLGPGLTSVEGVINRPFKLGALVRRQ